MKIFINKSCNNNISNYENNNILLFVGLRSCWYCYFKPLGLCVKVSPFICARGLSMFSQYLTHTKDMQFIGIPSKGRLPYAASDESSFSLRPCPGQAVVRQIFLYGFFHLSENKG